MRPKKKYKRSMCTSAQIGWNRSLFKVSLVTQSSNEGKTTQDSSLLIGTGDYLTSDSISSRTRRRVSIAEKMKR